jgi:hypothetical protein
MCNTFGKAVMPARIFEKVHVRNLAGNELQAEPGGVAGSGHQTVRWSCLPGYLKKCMSGI